MDWLDILDAMEFVLLAAEEKNIIRKIRRSLKIKPAKLIVEYNAGEYGSGFEPYSERFYIDRTIFEEKNSTEYRNKKLIDLVSEISKAYKNISKRISLRGAIPVPYAVILGYFKATNDFLEINMPLKGLQIDSAFGKTKTKILKKNRNENDIIIYVGESKKEKNETFDYAIVPKESSNYRSKFDKGSFEEDFVNVLNKIEAKETKPNKVILNIVASPSVSFLIGVLIHNKKFLYEVEHYSAKEKRSSPNVSIENTSILFL